MARRGVNKSLTTEGFAPLCRRRRLIKKKRRRDVMSGDRSRGLQRLVALRCVVPHRRSDVVSGARFRFADLR